ncbi:iron ABC transporter permease [Bacillus gobiensis]|uniref:FecCD family ABC transporter permease n=1 Tax=Bacillus gobiensis TaxID=1441095 RepID=UPI003D1EC3CE
MKKRNEEHVVNNRRGIIVITALFICLLIFSIINIGIGAVPISPMSVVKAIVGIGNHNEAYIILYYRLPRIVLAILVGGSLAVAGLIAQSVLQNPLAAPDTLGISGGASVAAVFCSLMLPQLPSVFIGLSAFIGGTIAALFVYFIAYDSGTEPIRLALVGIAVSAFCGSGVQLFLTQADTNVQTALLWLNGSLFGRTWENVIQLLPWAILCLIFAGLSGKILNSLQLGQDVAASLGIKVEWIRFVLLGISVLLTGSSVAAAGMIGFVGLISPHISRQLVGADHRYLLPVSILTGALILLIADSIGRGIMPPIEFPAGLITAVIGAPYFIYLLWRESRNTSSKA